jgi:hypothetical protein
LNLSPRENPPDYAAIQLAQLARLAELGMQLAESAARVAQRSMADPPPDPAPVTAEEAGTEHLYYPCPTDLPAIPPRNPGTLFNQFARTVQTCIALHQRLTTQHAKTARPIADPRRVILRRILRPFIHTIPADASHPPMPTHYTIDQAVDRELKADPDRATPITEILTLVCEEIGLAPALFDNELIFDNDLVFDNQTAVDSQILRSPAEFPVPESNRRAPADAPTDDLSAIGRRSSA